MKLKLILGLVIVANFLAAQSFTDITALSDFTDIYFGAVAFADVDGDGDKDVIITGRIHNTNANSQLYINDGTGKFTKSLLSPFIDVRYGAIACSDVDQDGDVDVMITGQRTGSIRPGSEKYIAKLYKNDGLGNFAEVLHQPFLGVLGGSINFTDVDKDGDEDVIVSGETYGGSRSVILYLNDGLGYFTQVINYGYYEIVGSLALSDIDGDRDIDFVVVGYTGYYYAKTKLYTNDGAGNFTEILDTPFENLKSSAVVFSDIDKDGNRDVLMCGENESGDSKTKLYTNDGLGNFTEVTGTPFINVSSGAIAFSDVDGDRDEDVLISGYQRDLRKRAIMLYTNDGTGNFNEANENPFVGISANSITFSDIDNDGDEDVLMTGSSGTKLFTNNRINSTLVENTSLNDDLNFITYPNPTEFNKKVFVEYNASEREEIIIRVYNILGGILKQQNYCVEKGINTIPIDITTLARGNYLIELDNGDDKAVSKFMVH